MSRRAEQGVFTHRRDFTLKFDFKGWGQLYMGILYIKVILGLVRTGEGDLVLRSDFGNWEKLNRRDCCSWESWAGGFDT